MYIRHITKTTNFGFNKVQEESTENQIKNLFAENKNIYTININWIPIDYLHLSNQEEAWSIYDYVIDNDID